VVLCPFYCSLGLQIKCNFVVTPFVFQHVCSRFEFLDKCELRIGKLVSPVSKCCYRIFPGEIEENHGTMRKHSRSLDIWVWNRSVGLHAATLDGTLCERFGMMLKLGALETPTRRYVFIENYSSYIHSDRPLYFPYGVSSKFTTCGLLLRIKFFSLLPVYGNITSR
jgi:hypothetical protein